MALAELGMHFPTNSRLDTFKLWVKISSLPDSQEKQVALELLSVLTELKRRGLEPESRNGKYE
jgi:hypothetical protein